MESRCRAAIGDKDLLEEHLTELEREKKGSEKKAGQLHTKLTKINSQLKEEKEVRCIHE